MENVVSMFLWWLLITISLVDCLTRGILSHENNRDSPADTCGELCCNLIECRKNYTQPTEIFRYGIAREEEIAEKRIAYDNGCLVWGRITNNHMKLLSIFNGPAPMDLGESCDDDRSTNNTCLALTNDKTKLFDDDVTTKCLELTNLTCSNNTCVQIKEHHDDNKTAGYDTLVQLANDPANFTDSDGCVEASSIPKSVFDLIKDYDGEASYREYCEPYTPNSKRATRCRLFTDADRIHGVDSKKCLKPTQLKCNPILRKCLCGFKIYPETNFQFGKHNKMCFIRPSLTYIKGYTCPSGTKVKNWNATDASATESVCSCIDGKPQKHERNQFEKYDVSNFNSKCKEWWTCSAVVYQANYITIAIAILLCQSQNSIHS